jgi:hypothetical protein
MAGPASRDIPMTDHEWRDLAGEALDNHLMTQHGWDMEQVMRRGTQASKTDNTYPVRVHAMEHGLDPDTVPHAIPNRDQNDRGGAGDSR